MLYVVIGIILLGLGFFSLFFPRVIWDVIEYFKPSRPEEPSRFFKLETRILGFIYCVLGIVTCSLTLWS